MLQRPQPDPEIREETATVCSSNLIDKLRRDGLITGPGIAKVVDRTVGMSAAKLLSVKSRWVDITPEQAREWLENNFRNRPVSDDVVTAYARDMVAGVWLPTHQGIAFNVRDELIDGQHRLLAIVKSGCTVRMMVTFGLPCEVDGKEMTTMDAVDRGRTRSVSDQLKIQHGIANGAIIAACTSLLGSICHGERTRRLSVGQTLEVYREFQKPLDWLIKHRSKMHGLRAAGVLAGFAFAMAAGDGSYESEWTSVMTGDCKDPASPMQRLREFLTGPDMKLLMRGGDRGLSELVLQALWHQKRGERPAFLELKLDGVNHYRSLQPARVEMIAQLFKLP